MSNKLKTFSLIFLLTGTILAVILAFSVGTNNIIEENLIIVATIMLMLIVIGMGLGFDW